MAVFRASKFNGSQLARITPEGWNQKPNVLQIHHSLRQPRFANTCGMNNGGCSHLCLPSPQFAGYGLANPVQSGEKSIEMSKDYVKKQQKRASKKEVTRAKRSPKFVPSENMDHHYEALLKGKSPAEDKMFTCACPDGLELKGTSQCYKDDEPVYSSFYVGSGTSDQHHDSIGLEHLIVDVMEKEEGRGNGVIDRDITRKEFLGAAGIVQAQQESQNGGISAGYIVLIVALSVIITGTVLSLVSCCSFN